MLHYTYAVTNTSPPNMLIVSIEIPPDPLAIENLIAPAGFLASFDPGLGFLDLIADTQSFSSGLEVGGFAFDSPLVPGDAAYEALNLNGVLFSGTTTGPIPEPTTALLLWCALAGLARRPRCRAERETLGAHRDLSHHS